uniref:Zinc transporter n=2 Tax=Corethron hystrix TaxID=216773 RepID=A0A7S1FTD3_9STRA|mmetsp:Transcript_29487/g.67832  ORF Transcript_29487/g.67832 Transcript_29487/m.67832 type:complete len:401 (+) Transcript_29487:92-1294(+)
MSEPEPNAVVAFCLVLGAGAATGIGASVVFFPRLVVLTSNLVLAGALGVSAGVMIYVSFVEIFMKSSMAFADAGYSEDHAFCLATATFFAGTLLMMILDYGVHRMSGEIGSKHCHQSDSSSNNDSKKSDVEEVPTSESKQTPIHNSEIMHCPGTLTDPAGDLESWRTRAAEEIRQLEVLDIQTQSSVGCLSAASETGDCNDAETPPCPSSDGDAIGEKNIQPEIRKDSPNATENLKEQDLAVKDDNDRKRLQQMGLKTALAIGIHNFPEGLATFVATLEDPRVGFVLAIAIGIHNIPEGLCVALPIYYATGNRMRAFLWACLSGLSEPIAALLGWAVLARSFNDSTYAAMFGLVAGMMVMICVKELLPTARRYDKNDLVVTYSFIGGMVVMALSLVLFRL